MASRSLLLALAIAALLAFSAAAVSSTDDLDDDLSFLDDLDDEVDAGDSYPDDDHHHYTDDDDDDADLNDFDPSGSPDPHYEAPPPVDEKDVVVLGGGNFSEFLKGNRHVLVEFYAPWCGHCQALTPEYAAAATELKGEDVALAKVDATEEDELAQKYEVQGFPTVFFFVDGVHKPYPGQRTKDGIVSWIKKKLGPAVQNVTTTEEAEKILTSESKIVLGFLESLTGSDSQELASASKLEDDVSFYQTVNSNVAKLFHVDPEAKRPSLVMLKKDEEKLALFDGQFSKSAIADFVFANKLPLVTTFTRDSAPLIFDNPIKKQLLLFVASNGSEEVLPTFQEAAKLFKGKLIFVYVEMDNEDIGKPVSEYFGVTGNGPTVLAYTGNEDSKKYILDGQVTYANIKTFVESFLDDKLKPFYKSDPIPETNDGDVKIIVGNNFDEIVLDESKDVLLEMYAPWCGHCQSLEPTYNKLAKHLRGIDSLVIAKMDGTTNEHPRAKGDGFPTLLFFPAGNKSFDPITVDTDRTVVAFYKFIKKHAAIPFKLQKPAAQEKSDGSAGLSEAKDEL